MLELGFWAEERGRGGGKDGGRAEPIPQKKTEKGDARRKGMKGGGIEGGCCFSSSSSYGPGR